MTQTLSPVLFLPHGGGPLPLFNDEKHRGLIDFLTRIPSELGQPKAILVISAHWEEDQPALTSARQPSLMYDYYGFAEEAYQVEYPATGDPALALKVADLLRQGGFEPQLDAARGFDHGMFVPLKLMYPAANIPCVQLSLLQSLNPATHIQMGHLLAPLREQGVLIVGSGLSFHNLKVFFSQQEKDWQKSILFDDWLLETCTDPDLSIEQRTQRLTEWHQAPEAVFCHPREEHLLPLLVCFGAASISCATARAVYNEELMGKRNSGFLWQ